MKGSRFSLPRLVYFILLLSFIDAASSPLLICSNIWCNSAIFNFLSFHVNIITEGGADGHNEILHPPHLLILLP